MIYSERVFIGIGSNRGSRRANCERAAEALREADAVKLVSKSPLYETAPWGLSGQRPFVNAVMEIRCTLGPFGLLVFLKGLERGLGRGHGIRWGPRVIDLDILFFGRRLVNTEMLALPHPRLHERIFVLAPMLDIAPDFIHPIFNESMRGLYERLKSRAGVKRPALDAVDKIG